MSITSQLTAAYHIYSVHYFTVDSNISFIQCPLLHSWQQHIIYKVSITSKLTAAYIYTLSIFSLLTAMYHLYSAHYFIVDSSITLFKMQKLISNWQRTICHFCSCALFSNIFHKINFMAKNGFDLCNFYSKLDFGKFLLENIFFSSLQKIQKFWISGMLKNSIKVTYSFDVSIIYSHFSYGKPGFFFSFFLKRLNRKLQMYFFWVKCHAKKHALCILIRGASLRHL